MVLRLALLLLLVAAVAAGDFYNPNTNDLRCSVSTPKFTTAPMQAAGWVAVDRTLFPGDPSQNRNWVWQSGTSTFRVMDQTEADAAETARVLGVRAQALIDRAVLQYARDNVSISPPAWADATVVAEAEAILDARIAKVDATGTTP